MYCMVASWEGWLLSGLAFYSRASGFACCFVVYTRPKILRTNQEWPSYGVCPNSKWSHFITDRVLSLGLFYKCLIPVTVLVFHLGTVVSRQIYKLQDSAKEARTLSGQTTPLWCLEEMALCVCVWVFICPSIPTYVGRCLHMPVFMWRRGEHGVWSSCRSFTCYRTINISCLIS